jgi:uncharacterized membrane protein YdfJ with MMPL/SSD domain
MGILVAVDMLTIALSALTFLPACIKLFPPKIRKSTSDEYVAIDPLMEEPG